MAGSATFENAQATLLENALIVDGTGRPPYRGSIAILGDRIVDAAHVSGEGHDAVDLSGLVLAPGFIDIHTHYDAQITWDPDLTPSCWHGVTTVVMGNCGFGIAPCSADDHEVVIGTLENVEGMSTEALRAGIDWSFDSFPAYLDSLERRPTRLNHAAFVGHTPVRLAAMGLERAREPATDAELAQMAAIVQDATEAGAWGFATSRSETHQGFRGEPVPSRGATYDEIERLAAAAAAGGARLVQATIGPGLFVDQFAVLSKAVDTTITWTALLTGVGRPGTTLGLLDRTVEAGGDVWPQISCRPLVMQFDLGDPAPLGRFAAFQEVLAVDRPRRAELYRDRSWRATARREVDDSPFLDWSKVTVEESNAHGDLIGAASVRQLAEDRGVGPLDVLVDIGLADELATRFRMVIANDDEDELAVLLNDDRCVLGLSDAGAHASQLCDACFSTHLLGYWVRSRGALSLEKAVWRLTGHPATVLGLRDRGTIRPGAIADLVAFDAGRVGVGELRRVHDLPGDADRLVAPSEGIEHVWVNGIATRANGADTAARPGRLLRSGAA